MDLEATLARVSANCLRGQPVPADLRALWDARLRGAADLLDGVDLTLADDLGPDFLAGYPDAAGLPPAAARAHRRMFEQISFVALTGDGGLVGYWVGGAGRPGAETPVVELDGTGRYALRGTSLADYLLQLSDFPEDFAVIRDWLTAHGIPVSARSRQEVSERLRGLEDPEARARKYLEEEQAKGD